MSELTLFLIRVAFLAILWIFVLSAISVIRSDMFGARVPEAVRGAAAVPTGRKGRSKPARARRGAPTHLLVVEGDNPGTRADQAAAPLLIGRGRAAAIKLAPD
ncbi:MAG: FHA domain-containing protein, partial [Nocardioides sp.]|nr:FHA domain-containing protein [Nocardioides sp.]